MKVVFLQGSPRRGGNTDIVCGRMAEAMREKGTDVEMVRVADVSIQGCTECFACQEVSDEPGCPLKDDMHLVYDQVLSADALVLASPVFCWGLTAQLKAPLDRFYAFCKFQVVRRGQFKCLVEGKAAALVVTAGGGPYDGAETCVAMFRSMARFLRMANRGELVAAPVGDPDSVRDDRDLMTRAAGFARSIIE